MTSESYCEKILPFIRHENCLKPHLILVQDNTPCHKATGTMRAYDRLSMNHMFLPVFSSDLNPIESLWNKMKDHSAMRCQEEGRDPSSLGIKGQFLFRSCQAELKKHEKELLLTNCCT